MSNHWALEQLRGAVNDKVDFVMDGVPIQVVRELVAGLGLQIMEMRKAIDHLGVTIVSDSHSVISPRVGSALDALLEFQTNKPKAEPRLCACGHEEARHRSSVSTFECRTVDCSCVEFRLKRVGQKCGFWTAGVCCQEVEPCPVHGVSPGASL